jgi:hypothetical protein
MKASLLALLLPAAASARFIEANEVNRVIPYPNGLLDESTEQPAEQFLVETSPGELRWITEDQKWELRRVSRKAHLHLVRRFQKLVVSDNWRNHRMARTSWTSPSTEVSGLITSSRIAHQSSHLK